MNAGVEFVPTGVKLAVEFVPVAVTVCVCVAIADPVKASAGTVKELPGADPPIAENPPLLVPLNEPEVVATLAVPFVPAGVPALVALEVTWLPVKVSAGTVPALPVNTGAATVPCGVYEVDPPVVPTSPLAACVINR